MEPERWKRLELAFHSALERPTDARDAALEAACAGDALLREEVESLLASHDQTGLPAGGAVEDAISLLETRAHRLQEGLKVGPYRIVREIGRGGMGAVYLAARADDTYQKSVAVKIIRRGLDTDDVVQRFRSERQILATLEHPNIARLLDGGATDDGLPYFAMEYIEGLPIDQYCDTHRLSITDRLQMFQSVCSAVSFAHQNLIIHRDIKPDNILVTQDGVPRLMDFGIAKLLIPGPESRAATLTIARRATPQYASPEQVRGEPITTSTDVYSLGVLLYRLLTGNSPYCSQPTTQQELDDAICNEEPLRPSLQLSQVENRRRSPSTSDAVRTTVSAREDTPEKLRRRLAGDLDNIVLMALRKEPGRRYTSVEQFSNDVSRHLGSLPVVARPDTAGYRVSKFIVRHRVGVIAALLLVVTLSAGVATTVWQARVAAAESRRARAEAEKAQRINKFLQDMLSYSSPGFVSSNANKNPDAKVSEIVELAARRAEIELANQPDVLAEMQLTIGRLYYAQGRYQQSVDILRRARENYARLFGPNSHETVAATDALASSLLRMGDNAEAETLFRKDIEIERNLAARGRPDDLAMAYALGNYGSMLDDRGDGSAADYLREALQHTTKLTGKDRVYVAILYNDLGSVSYRLGDMAAAERYNKAAIDEYRGLAEGTYVEMAAPLSNLGAILIREGRYAEAEPFVREGLALRLKLLGNAHMDTAMSYFRLSDLLYRKHDYPAAESAARESLDVFGRAMPHPEQNLYYANPLMELGLILNSTGRAREAEPYLRQALGIRARMILPGNVLIAATQGALGENLQLQRRYSEAEPVLLESCRSINSAVGETDPRTIEAKQRLTALYQSWGKPHEAATCTLPTR